MLKLREMEANPDYDKEKAEVWLIGMLILNCMSLTHYNKFYDWENSTLNLKLIEQTLFKIGGIYSSLLRDLTESCLEENPKKRCSMSSVSKFIQIRME